MGFLGIDWAEKHLDYCVENQSGDVLYRGRIDNNETGFAKMLARTTQLGLTSEQIHAAIESPHQPVVDFLIAREVTVYPLNPASISDYRKSLKSSGSKSDTADAQLIASYVRLHHGKLRAWKLSEPELRQLKLLLSDRDKIMTEKVKLQNQLRGTLLGYFPQAVEAFSDLSSKTALGFLTQYPSPQNIPNKNEQQWKDFLDKHRVFHPKARERFLTAIKSQGLTIDAAVASAKALFTSTMVSLLQSLKTALAVYQEQIDALFKGFDDSACFLSLPGVDVILGAKLLVGIGTDRQRFANAKELQAFFGTAPYTKRSGQYRSVRFRFACHKGMRTALYQMAFASLGNSQWAKSYFAKKRKEGKRASHAMRCLSNLWLKVIFAMWKDKTVYIEEKHLAAVTRHQLSQPI
jgi:transposase